MNDIPTSLPGPDNFVLRAEDVRTAVRTHRIQFWEAHACTDCGASLLYTFEDDKVAYHPNCGCTSNWTPTRPASYSEVAEIFNRHPPEGGKVMWADFIVSGLDAPSFGIETHTEASEVGIERALTALESTQARTLEWRNRAEAAETRARNAATALHMIRESAEALLGPTAFTELDDPSTDRQTPKPIREARLIVDAFTRAYRQSTTESASDTEDIGGYARARTWTRS